ncbi:MAG: OmpA family protein, partial [Flammeovirgaceae bacterium]
DDIVLKGVPSRFKVGEVFVLENLQFDQSSYALRKEAVQELNNLKKVLHQHPNMEIVLEGHTSNEGDEAKNMELSKQRLESARNYLIARGIDADRVGVKAFGETKPRADNSTIAGRIANRRIEMRIVKL